MQLSMACKFTLRYDNPMPESTKSPPASGTKNLATGALNFCGIVILPEKLSMFTENMKSMILLLNFSYFFA